MSKRRAPTIADAAAAAARGRNVVASAGQLDGAFLAALQRVNFGSQIVNVGDQVSTWADGVTLGDQVKGDNDGTNSIT